MYIVALNRFKKKSRIEKLSEIPSEMDGLSVFCVQHGDKSVKYLAEMLLSEQISVYIFLKIHPVL